ncbi:MAG: alpha-amylase [Bacteroidales bacterium]|nr:alpha-amylase [Bacteroidales bacterium]
MKKSLYSLMLLAVLGLIAACETDPKPIPDPDDNFEVPSYTQGEKPGNITYQLLIYSFADSDGDGIGDFNGIKQRLDYLDGLGVSAIWLSPAHPSDSYHGYDVRDYNAINPKYGTEQDFKDLIDAAHAKGIKVYMDYVLNHSGKGHPWFLEALADETSPYRDYYFICEKPSTECKNYPMLSGYSYGAGDWHATVSGSPKLTISTTTEELTNGTNDWNLYMWQDGVGDKTVKFVDDKNGNYHIVMDINGRWGMLVRKYPNWNAGSKFGAPEDKMTVSAGTSLNLVAQGGDMFIEGNGRYRIDLTNTETKTMYFMGAFGDWMPDLNYGDISQAENNQCFKDLAASVDKWIGLGIDGLRLDAVKHICGGMGSFNNTNNVTFLQKWYARCNETFRKTHDTDFYMVGEVWMDANSVAPYYKGIPACFEFDYWERLKWVLNERTGCYFAKDLIGYRNKYREANPKAIAATKLTNHDETRAASILSKDLPKLKQAAAFLLTSEGEPYIYQGEELGYWGKDYDDGGSDEYVRAPMVWDKASTAAVKDLSGRVESGLLTDEISVASQTDDPNSLLRTYYDWTKARNTVPALATGKMSAHAKYNDSNTSDKTIAAWYMTASDGSKALVLHNVGSTEKTVSLPDDKLSEKAVTLGSVSVSGTNVTLGANSSVVFVQ